jgi:hypothetical protein
MAWTQSDLDALDAAITAGVKSVTFADGRQTVYQNTSEMIALRKEMKAELQAAATRVSPRRRTTVGRICRP